MENLLVVHSVVWSVFPGIALNQRIHIAVLMLKSSFNFLGATMKSQKWSKSEPLGSNYTFKDGLVEYWTFWPNKYILKSFRFLANNLDTHFTWTHCVLNLFIPRVRRSVHPYGKLPGVWAILLQGPCTSLIFNNFLGRLRVLN